jgi:ribosomal protein S18 acetylase RimI-like enzyme
VTSDDVTSDDVTSEGEKGDDVRGNDVTGEDLNIRAVTVADAARVAEIFLTSRKTAMPWLAQPHTDDETRRWHLDVLVPRATVVVAERGGEVVGFAEPTDGWLHALYVAPSVQGSGVGSALFEHSIVLQPGGFDLWVFQRNTRAFDFYRRYGCVEVRRTDGADNEEREPDVLLRWSPTR